jgi:hypothetical protein
MQRGVLVAMAITPIIAAGAGVVIARFADADAGERGDHCAAPTVMLDIADGVSMATGGPNSIASREGNSCRVEGPEQVEVQADGRVQCVDVTEGQSLALTRRDGGVSLVVQESGR